MINIRITSNIPQVLGRMSKLPNRLDKDSEEIGLELAKWVQKSAKLRAPRFTGFLARSISYKQITKKSWEVGVYGSAARYGAYQEMGFTPHPIPIEFIEQHLTHPGMPGVDTRRLGGMKPRAWVISRRRRPQGFLAPATDEGLARLPEIAKNYIDKSLRR